MAQTMHDVLLRPQGDSLRGPAGITASPATQSSQSIDNARNLSVAGSIALSPFGPVASALGKVAGATIGTAIDGSNFAGPYGAPAAFSGPLSGFMSPAQHTADALSLGVLGSSFRNQAIKEAALVNPNLNPADVLSSVVANVRSYGSDSSAPSSRDIAGRAIGNKQSGMNASAGNSSPGSGGPAGDAGRAGRGGHGPR